MVRNKAIFFASGIRPDGTRDILIAVTDGMGGDGRVAGRGVSRHHAVDLHRASDSQLPGLGAMEGSQGLSGSHQTGLCSPVAEGALAELDAFEEGAWGRRFPPLWLHGGGPGAPHNAGALRLWLAGRPSRPAATRPSGGTSGRTLTRHCSAWARAATRRQTPPTLPSSRIGSPSSAHAPGWPWQRWGQPGGSGVRS